MAVAPDKDRAVITSARNFFRTMGESLSWTMRARALSSDIDTGGAFGLAIANALFNNSTTKALSASLTAEEAARITQSSISVFGSLSDESRRVAIDAYAYGLRNCYVLFTVVSGVCMLLAFFIKEVKFRADPPGLVKQETALSTAGDPEVAPPTGEKRV